MTLDSSMPDRHSTRASVFVAGLVTLSSVITTGTETSGEGTDLVRQEPPNTEPEFREDYGGNLGNPSSQVPGTATMPSEATRFRSESVSVEDQDLLTITEDLDLTSVHKDSHILQRSWSGYNTAPAHDEGTLRGASKPLSQSVNPAVPTGSFVAMMVSSAASSSPADQQSEGKVGARQSVASNESPPEKALYITGMGVVFVSFVNMVFSPPFVISAIAAFFGCGLGYHFFK